jgi:hypothetical protein
LIIEHLRKFTAVNCDGRKVSIGAVHSCEHHAALRRDISAMTIGPQENSPAAALAMSARAGIRPAI